jgi:prophage regulatory protein
MYGPSDLNLTLNRPVEDSSRAVAPQSQIDAVALLRLPQVLKLVPISRSAWWNGVREGRFPRPIKLGPKTTCWRAADLFALLNQLGSEAPAASRRPKERR